MYFIVLKLYFTRVETKWAIKSKRGGKKDISEKWKKENKLKKKKSGRKCKII